LALLIEPVERATPVPGEKSEKVPGLILKAQNHYSAGCWLRIFAHSDGEHFPID
jgi:hypothetical protein